MLSLIRRVPITIIFAASFFWYAVISIAISCCRWCLLYIFSRCFRRCCCRWWLFLRFSSIDDADILRYFSSISPTLIMPPYYYFCCRFCHAAAADWLITLLLLLMPARCCLFDYTLLLRDTLSCCQFLLSRFFAADMLLRALLFSAIAPPFSMPRWYAADWFSPLFLRRLIISFWFSLDMLLIFHVAFDAAIDFHCAATLIIFFFIFRWCWCFATPFSILLLPLSPSRCRLLLILCRWYADAICHADADATLCWCRCCWCHADAFDDAPLCRFIADAMLFADYHADDDADYWCFHFLRALLIDDLWWLPADDDVVDAAIAACCGFLPPRHFRFCCWCYADTRVTYAFADVFRLLLAMLLMLMLCWLRLLIISITIAGFERYAAVEARGLMLICCVDWCCLPTDFLHFLFFFFFFISLSFTPLSLLSPWYCFALRHTPCFADIIDALCFHDADADMLIASFCCCRRFRLYFDADDMLPLFRHYWLCCWCWLFSPFDWCWCCWCCCWWCADDISYAISFFDASRLFRCWCFGCWLFFFFHYAITPLMLTFHFRRYFHYAALSAFLISSSSSPLFSWLRHFLRYWLRFSLYADAHACCWCSTLRARCCHYCRHFMPADAIIIHAIDIFFIFDATISAADAAIISFTLSLFSSSLRRYFHFLSFRHAVIFDAFADYAFFFSSFCFLLAAIAIFITHYAIITITIRHAVDIAIIITSLFSPCRHTLRHYFIDAFIFITFLVTTPRHYAFALPCHYITPPLLLFYWHWLILLFIIIITLFIIYLPISILYHHLHHHTFNTIIIITTPFTLQ